MPLCLRLPNPLSNLSPEYHHFSPGLVARKLRCSLGPFARQRLSGSLDQGCGSWSSPPSLQFTIQPVIVALARGPLRGIHLAIENLHPRTPLADNPPSKWAIQLQASELELKLLKGMSQPGLRSSTNLEIPSVSAMLLM